MARSQTGYGSDKLQPVECEAEESCKKKKTKKEILRMYGELSENM